MWHMNISNLNFSSLERKISKHNHLLSLQKVTLAIGRDYLSIVMMISSLAVGIASKPHLAHLAQQLKQKVRITGSILLGFVVKYKTEMCRNWEVFGYCEFNESVSLMMP
jgi:hypothetical protein